jgi:hypothetical protein
MRIYEEAIDRDLITKRFEKMMATAAQAAEARNAWMLYCTRKFPLVSLRSLQGYDTVVQRYRISPPERTVANSSGRNWSVCKNRCHCSAHPRSWVNPAAPTKFHNDFNVVIGWLVCSLPPVCNFRSAAVSRRRAGPGTGPPPPLELPVFTAILSRLSARALMLFAQTRPPTRPLWSA